jgi:SAM-dependent methyltransferase
MTEEINEVSAGAFAERLLGIVNDAALALMISVGHRTRLFDTMAALPASTSEEIARAAGLDERYVREWLGSMTTGKIVEYDEARGAYRLPPEHAAFLTRAASPNNFGVTAQFIAVLGGVEDRVVECFEKGGGVPYSAYPRFHEVMAEESDQTVVAALFDAILPLVPGMVERLEAGADMLDVGCGSGRALAALAERFPKSRFVGYDFSDEAIGRANAAAAARGLSNLRYEVRDVAETGDEARFDFVTAFDAIHDQAKPARVLAEVARALRDDGAFLMVGIEGSSHVHGNMGLPLAPFGYAISCMHCMTVSLACGGAGLGAMWGREKALEMLAEAGFSRVDVHNLEHDVLNAYYVARKG